MARVSTDASPLGETRQCAASHETDEGDSGASAQPFFSHLQTKTSELQLNSVRKRRIIVNAKFYFCQFAADICLKLFQLG